MSQSKKNKVGAPLGNQNAAKGARLARIFERLSAEEEYKRLTQGASKMLDKFSEGNIRAGEFVRDTVDGKPAQVVLGPGEHGEHKLELTHRCI